MTKDAFIREVRDAEAMLYHISKSILKNDSDCGDAVQETILKAYEKLPTLKKEKYFRTWITRILINECKGILRKRKSEYRPVCNTKWRDCYLDRFCSGSGISVCFF